MIPEEYDVGIDLTGDAPWNIQLVDGFEFTSFIPNVSYYVNPLESTTFNIKQVNNSCGAGEVLGEANIEVRLPLATKEPSNETINLYPIPALQYIDIESPQFKNDMVSLSLNNILGLKIAQGFITFTNGKARWRLPKLPGGLYLLQFKFEGILLTKKLVIK